MVRKLLVAAALAALLAAPAHAQFTRVLLMPGVTYERQVQFTSHGPVAIHVLSAPRPTGLWSLKPVLSNDAIVGRERVTEMQTRWSPQATVAGVNGDLFAWADGRPSGVFLSGGVLGHPPLAERSSIGIAADGSLRVERIRMFGTWRGSGQRRPVDLNQSPGPNGISLFTPMWGPATPAVPGAVEAVIDPLPPATPNLDLTGPVLSVTQTNVGTPIPPTGAVLVARGTAAQKLLAEGPPGTFVTLRLLLSPEWPVVDALGGGPVLVRDGKPVFRHFELFSPGQLARNPRTAIGQLADGRILLVVVDGRQPGYSVGMTNFELAQTLVRLGAVTGAGLDAGGSSTMAFDGRLLNRPSDPGGERQVSEGLFVLYRGVFAAPALEPVLSPNGDGFGELQELVYKLPRPAAVTVGLIGPDKVERRLEEGSKPAGLYRLSWSGVNAEGLPEPEGGWRFTVTAVDDTGTTSTADRIFSLNRTLAALDVNPRFLRVGPNGARLTGTFTLARPARVTATVRTASGAVLATLGRVDLAEGTHSVVWNGRIGRGLSRSGRFLLSVSAANGVGRTELREEFTVRRVAGQSSRRR